MWYPAEIVLKSYLPFKLEEGMLFVNRISVGIIEPYVELWALEELPENDEEFLSLNGAPVNMFIIDSNENVLATEEQVGWWDEGEHVDELIDITLDDINLILRDYEGSLAISIDDEDEDNLVPMMFDNKVILSFDSEKTDWDVTLNEETEEEF